MINLLCLETSGLACSVAISQNGDCKGFKLVKEKDYRHAEVLHELVNAVVSQTGLTLKDFHGIAVSQGPGSYTGLRVGVSAAKGLSYALDLPLISVNTLQLIAAKAKKEIPSAEKYVAMIDARREEVFLQEFSDVLHPLDTPQAIILSDYHPGDTKIVFCGDGAEKAKKYFPSHHDFLSDCDALAESMCAFAQEKFLKKEFENTAYFEPFYLKEFYTGKSKN